MATGYEVRMYADIAKIATALERIATALEAANIGAGYDSKF